MQADAIKKKYEINEFTQHWDGKTPMGRTVVSELCHIGLYDGRHVSDFDAAVGPEAF
jgi:hypothetical protein